MPPYWLDSSLSVSRPLSLSLSSQQKAANCVCQTRSAAHNAWCIPLGPPSLSLLSPIEHWADLIAQQREQLKEQLRVGCSDCKGLFNGPLLSEHWLCKVVREARALCHSSNGRGSWKSAKSARLTVIFFFTFARWCTLWSSTLSWKLTF